MEPIAYTEFIPSIMKPVYVDERGQYVIDGEGKHVDGVWYMPREECDTPIVVEDDGIGRSRMS